MNAKALFEPLSWLLFGGLIVWGYQAATDKRAEKSSTATASIAQRKAANAAAVSAGPQTKVWQTPEGQVIELYVPSSSLGGLFVEVKRCIIWRGQGADSMHCEARSGDRMHPPDDMDYSDLR